MSYIDIILKRIGRSGVSRFAIASEGRVCFLESWPADRLSARIFFQ